MANDCTNILKITGPLETLKALREFVRSPESVFDFDRIIQTPEALKGDLEWRGPGDGQWADREWRGLGEGQWVIVREVDGAKQPISDEERARLRTEYGFDNWRDWRWERWGAKGHYGDATVRRKRGALHYEFGTPWSEPTPVLEALARRFPDVTINHSWKAEDYGCAWYEGDFWTDERITAKGRVKVGERLEFFEEEYAKAPTWKRLWWRLVHLYDRLKLRYWRWEIRRRRAAGAVADAPIEFE